MSFFSSLILFHPNPPPTMTVASLLAFATDLRNQVGVSQEPRCSAWIKYGNKIDKDYKTTNLMDWHESNGCRWGTCRDYNWSKRIDQVEWDSILLEFSRNQKSVYRGHIGLGLLTKESCAALTRWSDTDPRSGICPDSLGIEIDPICPNILSDEELVCTGLVSINFAGNGYFTWGPSWSDYSEQYRKAEPVISASRVARQHFPVSKGESFAKIADYLGPRFLNKDFYEDGDWILCVSETG